MSFHLKDPGSRIDYELDWTGIARVGQTIAESSWTAEPAEPGGLAIESDSFEALTGKVRISGGVAGHVYTLTNHVTFSDAAIDQRSVTVRVEER